MHLTNQKISEIAMAQSATDIGCAPADFLKTDPVIVEGKIGQGARAYYKEPISCNFVSYGNNVVASVKEEFRTIVTEYVHRYPFYHLFETPNALWLNEQLSQKGHKICFMAYYFLPNVQKIAPLPCSYELRLLYPTDFSSLYQKEAWGNALCAERAALDKLGVGAYHNGELIGLAGCSADCATMWQIGIDVLPAYRKQGIAAALTSRLAMEVLARGKVPFYCCAWSNIPSAKNAVKSGFVPAWAEMTVKPADFVDRMNQI